MSRRVVVALMVVSVAIGAAVAAVVATSGSVSPRSVAAGPEPTVTVSPAERASSFQPEATGGIAGSSLMDLSWVNTEDGWALSQQPCDRGTCAVVARTTDGGADWTELPATPALVAPPAGCQSEQCADEANDDDVSGVAFASLSVGYLYGPAMFITTDGGRTWRRVGGPEVAVLTVGDGQAFRVVYTQTGCPGPCNASLQAAPVRSTAWRTVVPGPLGTYDSYQLLVSGAEVYLASYGDLAQGAGPQQATLWRSVDAGAAFRTFTDPCVGKRKLTLPDPALHVLTDIAAAPGGVVDGVCTPRAGSGPEYLISSTDAGASWQPSRPLPKGTYPGGPFAAASASTIAVSTGTKLLVTTDGGVTWRKAATAQLAPGTAAVTWLGFETSQVGWWVVDLRTVWTTTDGGVHWSLPFG